MSVYVSGTLATLGAGPFATHDAQVGLDGWRSVADHAARNAIVTGTPLRCRQGMAVYTANDGAVWVLNTASPAGTDADWTQFGTGGSGSGASTNDTFIVKTTASDLPNSQALASLTTGLVKVTATTGVLSTAAAGTDYVSPSGTWTGNSSITTMGTIATGVWQGTAIGVAYGGTGAATLTAHAVLLGEGTSSPGTATIGTAGRVLVDQGSGSDPAFSSTGLTITQWGGALGTGSISGGTATFNIGTYNRWTLTLDHTQNVTLALSGGSVGQQFTLALSQDSTGAYSGSGGPVTWFAGIKWAGGSEPTLTTTASKGDIFTFLCVSSGSYWGMVAGQNF